MSDGKKAPSRLETRGQPRRILERIRPALREHVRPHTRNQAGELLGGGSILNARWDHRLSRDLDLHIDLATTEDGRAVLDRAAGACGGYRIEHPQFRRIEFERDKEYHADVSFDAPAPRGGEHAAVVDGEPAIVLSTAQIMSGKLWGRGMHAPARDLIDIAACAEADPEALEVAVNGLPDKSVDAILHIYRETSAQYRDDAAELEGVAEGLRPAVDDPTAYAGNAILDAKYERCEIRTRAGEAEIETTTGRGSRTRRWESAEALIAGMERNGINAFLAAQYRDTDAVIDATVEAMWTGRTETVLAIEPERPGHARAGVPRLEWTPGPQNPGGEDQPRGRIRIGDQAPDPAKSPSSTDRTQTGDTRARSRGSGPGRT